MEEQRTDSGQLVINWREIFELRLGPLQQEMRMMRQALEKLSEGMISASEWQRMKEQCQAVQTRLYVLDDRVEELEHYHAVGMWAFRIAVGMTTALSTAALIAYLLG